MLKKKPKILVCPLNWGLGHATRVVPIVEQLKEKNFNVWIAASKDPLGFLKKQFPELNFIDFPNYQVKYSTSNNQIFRFLISIPKIIIGTIKEHLKIKRIIKENKFDIILSDNRYGLWNRSTYNIFITHQLNIKLPAGINFFEPILNRITKDYINRYDECWVPDFKGEDSIAGELANPCNGIKNLYYIGLLSRYKKQNETVFIENEIDILFVLSGPEPQRTVFENIIYNQIKTRKEKFVLVRGTTKKRTNIYHFPVYDLVDTETLLSLIVKSKTVVCRAGYSSIMDLIALNKNAIIVPTPGQTEQEYLAEHLKNKGFFNSVKQKEFTIDTLQQREYNFIKDQKDETYTPLCERILQLKEK